MVLLVLKLVIKIYFFFHRKRKYYVSEFNKEDLNSPQFRHKFWLASKNTIKSQQQKIECLQKKNYMLQQKIVNMDQIIDHLKSEKNIDRNCVSLHKVNLK